VLANAGRDFEREAYVQASEEMANKTEVGNPATLRMTE